MGLRVRRVVASSKLQVYAALYRINTTTSRSLSSSVFDNPSSDEAHSPSRTTLPPSNPLDGMQHNSWCYYNSVTLIGNVGKPPQMTPNGAAFFPLATLGRRLVGGKFQNVTNWHSVIIVNKSLL